MKENRIIYCKIIENFDYIKKDTDNRLASMALKLYETGWKFSLVWLINILAR